MDGPSSRVIGDVGIIYDLNLTVGTSLALDFIDALFRIGRQRS
jgi:hypothetical protein